MNIELPQNRIEIPVVPQIECSASARVESYYFNINPAVLDREFHPDGGVKYNPRVVGDPRRPGDFSTLAPDETYTVSSRTYYAEFTPRTSQARISIPEVPDSNGGKAILVTVKHVGGKSISVPIACGAEQPVQFFIYKPDLEITTQVVPLVRPVVEQKSKVSLAATPDATKPALETQNARLAAQSTQRANLDIYATGEARGAARGRQEQAAVEATRSALENRDRNNPFVIQVNWPEVVKYSLIVLGIFGAVYLVNRIVAPRARG